MKESSLLSSWSWDEFRVGIYHNYFKHWEKIRKSWGSELHCHFQWLGCYNMAPGSKSIKPWLNGHIGLYPWGKQFEHANLIITFTILDVLKIKKRHLPLIVICDSQKANDNQNYQNADYRNDDHGTVWYLRFAVGWDDMHLFDRQGDVRDRDSLWSSVYEIGCYGCTAIQNGV